MLPLPGSTWDIVVAEDVTLTMVATTVTTITVVVVVVTTVIVVTVTATGTLTPAVMTGTTGTVTTMGATGIGVIVEAHLLVATLRTTGGAVATRAAPLVVAALLVAAAAAVTTRPPLPALFPHPTASPGGEECLMVWPVPHLVQLLKVDPPLVVKAMKGQGSSYEAHRGARLPQCSVTSSYMFTSLKTPVCNAVQ